MSLTERFNEELAAKQAAAQAEHQAIIRAAEAYDAHPRRLGRSTPAPKHLWMIQKRPVFRWAESAPDVILDLVQAFPPLPCYRSRTKDRTSSFGLVPLKDATEVEAIDGLILHFNNYEQRLKWHHALGEFSVLVPKQPWIVQYQYLCETDPHGTVIRVTDERLVVPDGHPPIQQLRYSSGKTEYAQVVGYGAPGEVFAAVQYWVDEANRQGVLTQAAYEAAKATSLPIVGRTYEQILAEYVASALRAGTLEQFVSLRSPDAEQDQALAKQHWVSYCKEHNISSTTTYFDYYDWACTWLRRQKLYVVEHEGKSYAYGHAWL